MLCKVVEYKDGIVIEHVSDRYFDVGECTICEEFAYGWYPIVHNLESDIKEAVADGVLVFVNDIDKVKQNRLLTADDIEISDTVSKSLKELQPLMDERLEILDSVKIVNIYATLTILVKTLSNDELTSAEKRVKVEECEKFYDVAKRLDEIEAKIASLKLDE